MRRKLITLSSLLFLMLLSLSWAYELKVIRPTKLISGEESTIRVIAYNPSTGDGVPDVKVNLRIYSDRGAVVKLHGRTSKAGALTFKFKVPLEDSLTFTVSSGENMLSWTDKVQSGEKLILTTDKPLYQPGQTVHIRALLLNPEGKPLKEAITITVTDPKGNRLLKRELKTDKFGVAHLNLHLATELRLGTYKITAESAHTSTERTIEVKRYKLPKFKVEVNLPKTYYVPDETIKGSVKATYFFGKPVKGEAEIALLSYEAGFREVGRTSCQLSNGECEFSLRAPAYGVGLPLERGKALLNLKVTVRDEASQEATKSSILKLVSEPLDVVVVPDTGELLRGVESLIYVSVAYPDGTPATYTATVSDGIKQVSTPDNSRGLTTLKFKPSRDVVRVEVRDTRGNVVRRELKVNERRDYIIIRPSSEILKVGDELKLEVLAPSSWGPKGVMLEAFVNGKSVGTWSTVLKGGRAQLRILVTPEMRGTLTLVAYAVRPNGDLISFTRKLVVLPESELKVELIPDRSTYAPGAEMHLKVKLSYRGKPEVGALELSLVDEALLFLAGKDPKILSLLTSLEEELLKPKYEVHGLSPSLSREEILKIALVKASEDAKPVEESDTYINKLRLLAERMIKLVTDRRYSIAVERFKEIPSNPLKLGFSLRDARDPWGTLMRFRRIESSKGEELLSRLGISSPYLPVSAGPDKRWNTPDDLSMLQVLLKLKERGIDLEKFLPARRRLTFMPAPGVPLMLKATSQRVVEEVEAPAKSVRPHSRASESKPKRIRSFFPETAYYNPEVITNERGEAEISVRLPDSITSWHLRALANTLNGRVGSRDVSVRVFQPFFVDLDLPLFLTRGDEASIPVIVYNYTRREQRVKVRLREDSWFKLTSQPELTLTLKPNEAASAYFTISAERLGVHSLLVEADTGEHYDAVKRTVEVIPPGAERHLTRSGALRSTEVTFRTPAGSIEDANKLTVIIYPSMISQVIGGLDRLLKMPYGCFEQTTSITYPNALILKYLRENNLTNPDIEARANYYLQVGYQRLISFEVEGGGFSWFGDKPANKLLTAFGLMEFADMNEVYPVDPEMVMRTRRWLFQEMEGDHWTPDSYYLHLETWSNLRQGDEVATAFIAWGISESSRVKRLSTDEREKLSTAFNWLSEAVEGRLKELDTYTLAIIANSLSSYVSNVEDREKVKRLRDEVLKELVSRVKEREDTAFWSSEMSGITFSKGLPMRLEVTALITQALIKAKYKPELAMKAIRYLISNKDHGGGWYTTQATIQSLRAILMAQDKAPKLRRPVKVTLRVKGRGEVLKELTLKPGDLTGYVIASMRVEGRDISLRVEPSEEVAGIYWTATLSYYIPWHLVKDERGPIKISVSYDRSQLEVGDVLWQEVKVSNRSKYRLNMVLVDVGLPPGFSLITDDLDKLVRAGEITRYEYTGRQVILYLKELSPGEVSYRWRLRAKYPVKVRKPGARAYEYYTPDVSAEYGENSTIVVYRRRLR